MLALAIAVAATFAALPVKADGSRPAPVTPSLLQADPVPHPMERRSVGAMVGGIVGVSAGSVLLSFGIFGLAFTTTDCNFDMTSKDSCVRSHAPEAGLLIGGVLSIAVAIPLLIYGAKKVPAGSALLRQGAFGAASPLPAWSGAPGGAGWKWRF